jgi:peptidoglycan/LPS O-acetylase OafA/YrhL
MNKQLVNPSLLQTKQHFAVLDGLRGVAALAVVVFHFMECVYSDYSQNFIGHGFLAVDFFFCLSGFVIGYAYDDRMGKMSKGTFFTGRLIRLHPLVVLGTVLGVIGFFLDPLETHAIVYSAGKLILLVLCSLFMVPMSVMEDRYFNQFGFNAPAWSLFWEYVANIVYAFVLWKVGKRLLIVLTIIAGALLVWVAYRAGNVMGGWGKGNFWDGGARVFYSFLAGLLIYRFNWVIRNKLGFMGLAVLLSLTFVMPLISGINWLLEALVVLFYFPLIDALGAGTTAAPRAKKLCEFAGNISYPLYMTHYWGIFVFAHYLATYKPGMGELAWIVAGGTVFLVAFAYVVMRVYDVPVRKYLTNKRKKQA